jgi:hypothetical protein
VVNNVFGLPKLDQALSFNAAQWYDIKVIYDRITGKMSVYMNNSLVATWTDPTPYSTGGFISFRSGNCKFSIDEIKVYRSRASTVNVTMGTGNAFDIRYQNPNPTQFSAKIKSINQDSAGNLSAIYYHDLNVDWTPPSNLTFVNDGNGSDIGIACTKDSLQANWSAAADSNSAISKYWYSIGTTPGSTNVLNWTNNWGSTSVTSKSLTLTHNTNYYINVQAENGAGLLSNIVSSNGQKADTTCIFSGIETIGYTGGLKVYPNPFQNSVQIQLINSEWNEAEIKLIDILGKVVYQSEIIQGITTINTSGLSDGLYTLQISNSEKQAYYKLTKQ